MSDKPKALEVVEKDVKPPKLPTRAGTNYGPPGSSKGDDDVAAEMEETLAETEETPEEPDTRPRHERRRSHREKMKAEKEQRGAAKKYMQQLAKPIRFRDMNIVVNQVAMQLRPTLVKIQDDLDKLAYLPDFLADVMDPEEDVECTISGFEEWFKKLKAELEAEDTSTTTTTLPPMEEEDVSPPETEETQ